MAYIQVEASVRTHKKFLKAGPAASWLWLCGMGYCQDGLTDGFIPFEAIDYLGVKPTIARKLKSVLVAERLWHDVAGGWRVHDYLEHNRAAVDVRATRERRRAGGALGGRPTKETSDETSEVNGKVNLPVNHPANLTENPSVLSSSHQSSATATSHQKPIIRPRRMDAAFEHECGIYLPQRAHDDFSALHPGEDLFPWFEAICSSWAGRNTGADMFKFWKARHDERWPPERPSTGNPTEPEWARKWRAAKAAAK